MEGQRSRPLLAQVTDELAAHLAVDELFGPCLRFQPPPTESVEPVLASQGGSAGSNPVGGTDR